MMVCAASVSVVAAELLTGCPHRFRGLHIPILSATMIAWKACSLFLAQTFASASFQFLKATHPSMA